MGIVNDVYENLDQLESQIKTFAKECAVKYEYRAALKQSKLNLHRKIHANLLNDYPEGKLTLDNYKLPLAKL